MDRPDHVFRLSDFELPPLTSLTAEVVEDFDFTRPTWIDTEFNEESSLLGTPYHNQTPEMDMLENHQHGPQHHHPAGLPSQYPYPSGGSYPHQSPRPHLVQHHQHYSVQEDGGFDFYHPHHPVQQMPHHTPHPPPSSTLQVSHSSTSSTNTSPSPNPSSPPVPHGAAILHHPGSEPANMMERASPALSAQQQESEYRTYQPSLPANPRPAKRRKRQPNRRYSNSNTYIYSFSESLVPENDTDTAFTPSIPSPSTTTGTPNYSPNAQPNTLPPIAMTTVKATTQPRSRGTGVTRKQSSSASGNKRKKKGRARARYACQYCDKTFTLNPNLKRHILNIHQEPDKIIRYKCDLCAKSFKQTSDLRRHQLVHTNERKFACDQCDKKFKQKSHLVGHKKMHERASRSPR